MANEDLFAPNNSAVESNDDNVTFDQLVGEGKRYKDPDALAKAKAESDRAIKAREQENAELRKELNTRLTLEEFYNKTLSAKVSTPQSNPPVEQPPKKDEAIPAVVSKDDVMNLVREALNTENTKQARESNVANTRSALEKAWGSNYLTHLETKMSELGIGKDFLGDIAARSPKAALALLGVGSGEAPKGNPNLANPPKSSQGTGIGVTVANGSRNKAYWDNVRKNDPKSYFSKEQTVLRHKDALELRDAWDR